MEDWFGHPVGLVMHRLFFDQLGPSGVWMEDAAGEPAGFLLGLVSEAEPDLAYVHMHVVAPALRGAGAGERLYREFCARAERRGCPGSARSPRPTGPPRAGSTSAWASSARPRRPTWARARTGSSTSGRFRSTGRLPPPGGPKREGEMGEPAPQDERRAHRRAAAELRARVIANGSVVEAQSVNLSEGGVLLAGTDFPSARQVRIEIELAEMGWHALDAEVVRHDDRGSGALAARFAEAATGGGREAIRAFFETRLGGG